MSLAHAARVRRSLSMEQVATPQSIYNPLPHLWRLANSAARLFCQFAYRCAGMRYDSSLGSLEAHARVVFTYMPQLGIALVELNRQLTGPVPSGPGDYDDPAAAAGAPSSSSSTTTTRCSPPSGPTRTPAPAAS